MFDVRCGGPLIVRDIISPSHKFSDAAALYFRKQLNFEIRRVKFSFYFKIYVARTGDVGAADVGGIGVARTGAIPRLFGI